MVWMNLCKWLQVKVSLDVHKSLFNKTNKQPMLTYYITKPWYYPITSNILATNKHMQLHMCSERQKKKKRTKSQINFQYKHVSIILINFVLFWTWKIKVHSKFCRPHWWLFLFNPDLNLIFVYWNRIKENSKLSIECPKNTDL